MAGISETLVASSRLAPAVVNKIQVLACCPVLKGIQSSAYYQSATCTMAPSREDELLRVSLSLERMTLKPSERLTTLQASELVWQTYKHLKVLFALEL